MSEYRLRRKDLSCLSAWMLEGYVPEDRREEAHSALVGWIREIKQDFTITSVGWEDNHEIRFGVMEGVWKLAHDR